MGRRIRAAQERREMRLANARAEREMVAELDALRAVRERYAIDRDFCRKIAEDLGLGARQDEAQRGGGK